MLLCEAWLKIDAAFASETRSERKACGVMRASTGRGDQRAGPHFATWRRVSQPLAPKVLVVFFSRTGTTRKAAEALAHAAGADLEELRESRSRSGILGYLRSGYEATYRRPSSDLVPPQRDPRNYDIVFIGGPTWSASLSSPVRAYLERQRAALPDTGLFATCGGPRADAVLAQMSELLTKPALAKLTLPEAEVKRSPAVQVAEFLETALVAWEKQGSKARLSTAPVALAARQCPA
jgi:menaquinone-dependent protoporphyrinogen IX oxidase